MITENNQMSQPMSVLTSKKTQEWYTPKNYIDMVKQVFGGVIQLDPASNEFAQEWVGANLWYGLEHPYPEFRDGMEASWNYDEWNWHTVFCNPPYNGNTTHWVKKAESEYLKNIGSTMEIILLVNSATGYKWFEDLMDKWVTCSVRDRIRFIDEKGNQGGQAKKASVFAYLGHRKEIFAEVFKKIGRITYPTKEL